MTRALAVLLGGLSLSLVGTATATDMISLRELFHALNVPLVSGLVIGAREAMGTSVAHTLEPASAVLGVGVMLAALPISPSRAIRALVPARV
jgi:hypothetical protein